ncbi:HXXEE domain-containing protein [Streptomyces sp. NPDC049954]|uniref:HXXEE domain-containing protein n=1 Tax=Streptomyces sp. NPDC049954 TaxID=3155779 RepID=UPI00341B7343
MALSTDDLPTAPLPRAATLGLFWAWALHDIEELLTHRQWYREDLPALRERGKRLPEPVWRALEVSPAEFARAVAVMAFVVGAAAGEGRRTGGRSAFYQSALTGFGAHGLVHLAQAAVTRSRTPGAVTAPVLVIPFALWARSRLRRAGLLHRQGPRDVVRGALAVAAATAVSHAVARRPRRTKAAEREAAAAARRP